MVKKIMNYTMPLETNDGSKTLRKLFEPNYTRSKLLAGPGQESQRS